MTEPVPTTTPAEPEGLNIESIRSVLAEQVSGMETRIKADLDEKITELRKPQEGRVSGVEFLNRNGDGVIKLRSPYEPLYARLGEKEREFRSPDADHWYQQWIIGESRRNDGQRRRAEDELSKIFGRSTTEEGTAGTDGGISTGTGGPLIPRPLSNVIMIARDRVAQMRMWAQNVTMTAQSQTVPTMASMTAAMAAESTTAAQGEPTIAEVQLNAKKAQVKAIVTIEAMEDSAFNLVNMFGERAGGAIGVLEDVQFFKAGNGAPNISAFLAGTAFSEDTTGVYKYLDHVNQYYAVAQQYRNNAVWLVASNVLKMLTTLRNDTTGAQFYAGLDAAAILPITDNTGARGTLMGRPVYEVPFTNGTIWFGDVNASYIVGTRAGIQFRASEHRYAELDQILWIWTERIDGINTGDSTAQANCTGITSATTAAS